MSTEHKSESMAYRRLKYFILNLAFLAALYQAIVNGRDWAENISVFYCVVVSLLTFSLLIDDVRSAAVEKVRREGTACPKWMNGVIDMAAIIAIASAGWYWCATLFLAQLLLVTGVVEEAKKPGQNNADCEA